MASKAKATQAKEKEPAPEKEEGAPDSPLPLLDLSDAGVKKMIKAAKKRGYVTIDQINEVMAGDRFIQAGEFGHHKAFLQSGLEGRIRIAAAEITHAKRRQRDRRQLGIGRKLRGVLDLAIGSDPVGFGHSSSPVVME